MQEAAAALSNRRVTPAAQHRASPIAEEPTPEILNPTPAEEQPDAGASLEAAGLAPGVPLSPRTLTSVSPKTPAAHSPPPAEWTSWQSAVAGAAAAPGSGSAPSLETVAEEGDAAEAMEVETEVEEELEVELDHEEAPEEAAAGIAEPALASHVSILLSAKLKSLRAVNCEVAAKPVINSHVKCVGSPLLIHQKLLNHGVANADCTDHPPLPDPTGIAVMLESLNLHRNGGGRPRSHPMSLSCQCGSRRLQKVPNR